jgi:hypothetical protein
MSEPLDLVYNAVDEQHSEKPAATRRQMVAGAAGLLGSMGLLGLPGVASATNGPMFSNGRNGLDNVPKQDLQRILNVAATAEILATIVNTVGAVGSTAKGGVKVGPVALPADGNVKISASAAQELGHFEVLKALGAKELTRKIWVPDAVFASSTNFLNTVEVGDQIFINAYLIATTAYAKAGLGDVARAAAEFMGVEAVHRAFARDLNGKQGNDRMFMKFDTPEEAPGAPDAGQKGFIYIETAVERLQAAGFGFGAPGAGPGKFYEFDTVKAQTPNPDFVNTREPE